MKNAFRCMHHVVMDGDGCCESIKACSSKETAGKIAGSIGKGKTFMRLEEKGM